MILTSVVFVCLICQLTVLMNQCYKSRKKYKNELKICSVFYDVIQWRHWYRSRSPVCKYFQSNSVWLITHKVRAKQKLDRSQEFPPLLQINSMNYMLLSKLFFFSKDTWHDLIKHLNVTNNINIFRTTQLWKYTISVVKITVVINTFFLNPLQ